MSLTAIRAEQALALYLQPLFEGIPILRGHSNEDMPGLPRIIATVTAGEGDLKEGAGVEQFVLQIELTHSSGELDEDPDPVATLARLAEIVRGALCLDEVPTILAALNSPASGPDLRPVKGVGFSGIEYQGFKEGRDLDKNQHGILLGYYVWAQRES